MIEQRKSGRIVLEIDTNLKQDIFEHCRESGITLKEWFLENIEKTLADTKPLDKIRKHSAFISHSSEDKDAFVRPLARELQKHGHDIWYDEFELEVGDSLRETIDQGLVSSAYGIVVLSKSFFAKNWTKYELNGLLAKEIDGKKVILPVWHGITKEDIIEYSPYLADKLALSTYDMGIKQIAEKLSDAIKT